MKFIRYIIKSALVFSLFIMATSCTSFLNEYSEDLAYIQNVDDLDQLLIGSGYMVVNPRVPLRYSNFYLPYLHYISDETQEVIGETRYHPEANIRKNIFGYYTWQKKVGVSFDGLTHNDESVDWLRLYNHISTLNVILSEAEAMVPQTKSEKEKWNRVVAEASFLRAAYYFWLVNLYAEPYSQANSFKPGVPLKLEQHIIDKKYKRATIKAVYDTILDDLKKAESLMPDEHKHSKYRISKAGLYLFMSRVYLYMQEWSDAAKYAKKCIQHGGALQNLNGWTEDKFFLSLENSEIFFSMGGSLVYSHLDAGGAPVGSFEVSDGLYNLFSENDLRKTVFLKKEKTKALNKDYYVYPIKQNPRGPYRAEISENFCLRLSEAYLNLAEALAFMNKVEDSQANLNELLRKRMKLSSFTPINNLSQKELIDFIRDERRRELCFEGHRWFDLRRYRVAEPFSYKTDLRNSYTIYVKEGRISRMQATYEYLLPANEDFGYTLPIPTEQKMINDIIEDNNRIDREPDKIIRYE